MEIFIGKTAGFCFGVANAVNKTSKILKEKSNVYCLGELVHNKQVTEELEKNGLKIIHNIDFARNNLIIRAHGAEKDIYEKAKKMNLNILDLTCPKVLKIHSIAEEYSKKRISYISCWKEKASRNNRNNQLLWSKFKYY